MDGRAAGGGVGMCRLTIRPSPRRHGSRRLRPHVLPTCSVSGLSATPPHPRPRPRSPTTGGDKFNRPEQATAGKCTAHRLCALPSSAIRLLLAHGDFGPIAPRQGRPVRAALLACWKPAIHWLSSTPAQPQVERAPLAATRRRPPASPFVPRPDRRSLAIAASHYGESTAVTPAIPLLPLRLHAPAYRSLVFFSLGPCQGTVPYRFLICIACSVSPCFLLRHQLAGGSAVARLVVTCFFCWRVLLLHCTPFISLAFS
jgi:hypothetical protein